MSQSVVIVILNWNGLSDTLSCLESLEEITYSDYEIIVVDNGSTDGSVACLSRRYPDITLLENKDNLGYAEGNNVGVRCALEKKADYVLLLNNDTIVEPKFLSQLVKTAESDQRIGIVGPKVVFFDDPTAVWSIGARVNLFTGIATNLKGSANGRCSGIRTVGYVTGCALLIKRHVIEKIGFLDKDYFLYFEEADWNFRAHKCGYLSVVDCGSTVLHKAGASVQKVNDSQYYYFARNRLRFMRKHGKWYHFVTFVPCAVARYSAFIVWNLIWRRYARCRYILAGVRDYARGQYGVYR